MKQKILIIGDSLASHRDDDDYLLNERWPSLLENKSSFSLINLSKSFSTTKVLKTLKRKIIKIKPSHVLIQLGIVDCVPRTFHKIETQILYRLPKSVRLFLIRTIKKIRTQSFSRSYVKPNEFKNNIKHFCADIDCKVIFIKILPASRTLISKNKNAQSAIVNYNKIIDEISSEISNFTFVEVNSDIVNEITLDDGYHLNKEGHQYLSKLILPKLKQVDI